jgi:acyl-CoA synthetase (NDP forming)
LRAVRRRVALSAAAQLGGPVALKADVAGLVHKSEAGAVELDLHGPDEVRAGYRALAERFGPKMSAAMIQPMIARVSRLADDLPQVAEFDLNPVIARADGAYVLDARVRVVRAQPADPYLRRLR